MTEMLDRPTLRAVLADAVARAGSGPAVLLDVRGPRQAGKSRLVTEAIEAARLPAVHLTGRPDEGTAATLRRWPGAAAASIVPFPEPGALADTPMDWTQALRAVPAAAAGRPAALVLDEAPWLLDAPAPARARPAGPPLLDALRTAWGGALGPAPLLVVLIGPGGAMPALDGDDEPWSGRRATLAVEPLSPAECARAWGPDAPASAAFDLALATGGLPRLVSRARDAPSVVRYLQHQLSDELSEWMTLGERIVGPELASSPRSRVVLAAVADAGPVAARFSPVVARLPDADAIGTAAQTAVSRALRALETAGLVAIETPVPSPPATKLREYRLRNPYLTAWLRFGVPHLAELARGRPEAALRDVEEAWRPWRAQAVAPLVHEAVRLLADRTPALAGAARVGSWWTRDPRSRIDLTVATAHRRIVALGTIRWRERSELGAYDARGLAAVRSSLPGAGRAALVGIGPRGADRDAGFDLALDAEDLLEAWRSA